MTDFWNDVRDDGSPAAALNVAEQGVRSANHRSAEMFDPQREGWRYVPDAYRCIGELKSMVGMLPQVLLYLRDAMMDAERRGWAGLDRGAAGETVSRIESAGADLEEAVDHLALVGESLEHAQQVINAIHYSGPEIDHGD